MKLRIVKLAFTCLTTLPLTPLMAQVNAGSPGIFITKGTTFSADGLLLIPASDVALINLKLERNSLPVVWPDQAGIRRVYSFSKPVSFQGSLGLRYNDSELNGNQPDRLRLAWTGLVFSNDPKRFTIGVTSVSQVSSRSIGQVFTSPVDLAAITAVAPGAGANTLQANNIITPDGDGINDVWTVRGIENYPQNEVRIFDREGRVLFTATGYRNNWDATVDENPLPEDTYYYILYLTPGKEKITGFISVVRKE